MACLAGVTICACGTDTAGSRSGNGAAPQANSADASSTGSTGSGQVATEDPALVAVADLAERLGIDRGLIDVVESRPVTWPDASIGCPRPGMQYAQVLVSGSLIVLRAAGRDYHYHSSVGRKPFYCANPQPPLDETQGHGEI